MNERRIKNEITIRMMAEYRKILGELKPGVIVEAYEHTRWIPYEISDRDPIRESCDGRSVMFSAMEVGDEDAIPRVMSVKYEYIRIKKVGE